MMMMILFRYVSIMLAPSPYFPWSQWWGLTWVKFGYHHYKKKAKMHQHVNDGWVHKKRVACTWVNIGYVSIMSAHSLPSVFTFLKTIWSKDTIQTVLGLVLGFITFSCYTVIRSSSSYCWLPKFRNISFLTCWFQLFPFSAFSRRTQYGLWTERCSR